MKKLLRYTTTIGWGLLLWILVTVVLAVTAPIQAMYYVLDMFFKAAADIWG